MTETGTRPAVSGPNPHHVGACPECGSYRADGRPPYLHQPGCPHESDLQFGRWLREHQSGDHGGPPLYCTDPGHDHERLTP
jgi:hypothetical protein